METVERYRQIVHRLINEYAQHKPSHGQIETEIIIDPERDHYQLMHIGWDKQRRVHGSVIHIDIIKGKIWIQYDGTNRPVAEELLAAGVPREDIILGFHPASVRQYTDFGVFNMNSLDRQLVRDLWHTLDNHKSIINIV